MNTDDETLISAMWVLARDIQSEDGIANAAIAEAANRLQQLKDALRDRMLWVGPDVAKTWRTGCRVLIRRNHNGINQYEAENWHRPDCVDDKARTTGIHWLLIENNN